MAINLNDFIKKANQKRKTGFGSQINTSGLSAYGTNQPLTNVSSDLQNAVSSIPDQRQIQQNIQQIAPNPARKTTAYNGTAPVQGYNGVNQGGNGYLGMIKSLVSNRPQLKPITAQDPLSSDWYNQVLANVNARNQMKYNMALSNVLGSIVRTNMQTQAQRDIANQKIQSQEQMNDKLLQVKQQYNNIMDNYYKGLLDTRKAEIELKKLGIKNPQDHLAQIAFQARVKKYPDPQTWWNSMSNAYTEMGYDLDIKDPNEINKAYQYYLKTGNLPKPKATQEEGSFFNSPEYTGFELPQEQAQRQMQNAQHIAQNATYNDVLEFARQRGLEPEAIKYDPNKKAYLLIDTNRKQYWIR